MSDIRDVSRLPLPLYRNDPFGAMSFGGTPYGMERALRTTVISPMIVRSVTNTQVPPPRLYAEYQPPSPEPRQLTLSEVVGEKLISGQTNLSDMNKKLANFVLTHLSAGNPEFAKDVIIGLLKKYTEGNGYLNITAQEAFAAVAFFISDIDNWNGKQQEIIVPEWAKNFFIEHHDVIQKCINDINSQLDGNHHSRKFAKKSERLNNHDYDKILLSATTKAQHDLLIKAGGQYLSQQSTLPDYGDLALHVISYHDAVVEGLKTEVCRLIIANAKDNFSVTLSTEDASAILDNDVYYKAFHAYSNRLKNDLLDIKPTRHTLSGLTVKARHKIHSTDRHHNKPNIDPAFIKVAGLLLTNAYSYPVPDAFSDKIFKRDSNDI